MHHTLNRSHIFITLVIFVLSILLTVSPISTYAQSTTPVQINGTFNPDSIYPSQTSRLTINVFNPNVDLLTDVNWIDNLPDDLVVASTVDPLVVGCGSDYTLTAVPDTSTISLSNATTYGTDNPVNPGICSVTISVTSFKVGNYTNTISASEGSVKLNGFEMNYEYDAEITLLVLSMDQPELTKSFTSPINLGEVSQMEINIENTDPNVDLTQVELVDNLPAGMMISDPLIVTLSNCGSGSLDPIASGDTSLTLSDATIAIGETCQVLINVETSGTGIFTNTITPGDLTTYQNVTIPSEISADLIVKNVELEKEFFPADFQAGGTSTITITITNPDTINPLTNVNFTDTLPANLNVVSGSGAINGMGCLGTVVTDVSGQISLVDGSIPARGSCEIIATVEATVADAYTNTINCEDMTFEGGTPVCEEANAELIVYPLTLGVGATKSFSPDVVPPGVSTILRIKVTAPGDTDLTDFSLTDNLPDNVFISSPANATQSNCGLGKITANEGASIYQFSEGTILAGETCTLSVLVASSEYGPHTNTILTTDISNNENRNIPAEVEGTFTVRDIAVEKHFDSNLVGRDGITRLSIKLINKYISQITDLQFSDILGGTPTDGVIIADPSNLTNTCGGSVTAVAGTQLISLSGGSLEAYESCDITVDVQGKSSTTPPQGTTYTNTIEIGEVGGIVDDSVISQNWFIASDSLRVGSPDFKINKKFDPILVTGDTASTMTITLVNPLSSEVNNISFTDTLPTHMLLAEPSEASVGTCGGEIKPAADRESFTYSGGNLPGNGSCKLTIKVVMEVTGNLINTIPQNAVMTTQGATNEDSTSATLTNLSSVSIEKHFSPNPVTPGSISQLTLTIKKVGIGIGLSGLGFTDDLPDGLTIAASPAPNNSCGGNLNAQEGDASINLSDGSLPVGTDTCDIVVSVLTPSENINIDGYTNTIPIGSIITNEGYTNVVKTSDILGIIFDPPSGMKVHNSAGLPNLEWKLVWINNTNSSAVNTQIRDNIPVDTTFVTDSLTCEARGSSKTESCEYDSINNQIFWSGKIGPDRDAVDEDDAQNEIVISFLVEIPDIMNYTINQSTALTDTNGDGDFDDEVTAMSVSVSNESVWSRYADSLPNSGFAPSRKTILPVEPSDMYRPAAMQLEIPNLQILTDVVRVPVINGQWQVSWLGDRLGYLESTSFPTWNGNSVITGHVYDQDGLPGIFHDLQDLSWGDEVIMHAYGQSYVYEVRTVDKYVLPEDTSSVYMHEDYPWLTLITCHGYDSINDSYKWRVVVRAVQTDIF